MIQPLPKIKLEGFNNLTKTLSFNVYDVYYLHSESQFSAYQAYIAQRYSAEALTPILSHVAQLIGADILNIATQNYQPQGASVTLMVCEGAPLKHDSVVCHLNKSHITVHTYPESQPQRGVNIFRADIDVASCGLISPLTALDYLLSTLKSDIATLDYRVRGFTRDVQGRKCYLDHAIQSIQEFMPKTLLSAFQRRDVNRAQDNLFHTRMMRDPQDIAGYLFDSTEAQFSSHQLASIRAAVAQEMLDIFYGRNLCEV